jgi:uncharacterized protein (TIGR03083 family)
MEPGQVRRAFGQAADFYISTVQRIPPDRWTAPGLGIWSVRDLVGHTSRSLLTIESYLGKTSPGPSVVDPATYFVTALAAYGDPTEVAERGRQAGAALGEDPLAMIRTIAERVLRLVAASPDDALIGMPVCAMQLATYLPTRVFELTVHTLDLAAALELVVEPPDEALTLSLELAANLAQRRGHGATVLLALSGRRPLPSGFSLL